jgi:hypothetical protein
MVRDAMEQSIHCRIFTADYRRQARASNFPGEFYGNQEIICAKIQIVDYGSG